MGGHTVLSVLNPACSMEREGKVLGQFGSSFHTLGGRFGVSGFQLFLNLHEEEQEGWRGWGRRQQLSSD